jgi:hypothetical protein
MSAEGVSFFLSDTNEDHRIAHWPLSAHLMGPQVFRFLAVRSQPISGNGGHDNYGRGEKVSGPKVKEIGGFARCERLRRVGMLRIRRRCADNR